jgi:hypothetical protein
MAGKGHGLCPHGLFAHGYGCGGVVIQINDFEVVKNVSYIATPYGVYAYDMDEKQLRLKFSARTQDGDHRILNYEECNAIKSLSGGTHLAVQHEEKVSVISLVSNTLVDELEGKDIGTIKALEVIE